MTSRKVNEKNTIEYVYLLNVTKELNLLKICKL